MSLYKGHNSPPHYDELGIHLNVDRENRDNPYFRKYMSEHMKPNLRVLLDEHGEIDGSGWMHPRGRVYNPNSPGITLDDTAPLPARHSKLAGAFIAGYFTIAQLGVLYYWAHFLGRII